MNQNKTIESDENNQGQVIIKYFRDPKTCEIHKKTYAYKRTFINSFCDEFKYSKLANHNFFCKLRRLIVTELQNYFSKKGVNFTGDIIHIDHEQDSKICYYCLKQLPQHIYKVQTHDAINCYYSNYDVRSKRKVFFDDIIQSEELKHMITYLLQENAENKYPYRTKYRICLCKSSPYAYTSRDPDNLIFSTAYNRKIPKDGKFRCSCSSDDIGATNISVLSIDGILFLQHSHHLSHFLPYGV